MRPFMFIIALSCVAFVAAQSQTSGSFASFGSFELSDPYEPGTPIAGLHYHENCAEFCPAHWVGDNICDYDQCYNEGCAFDGGDCDHHHGQSDDHCSDGCWPGWEGDGICDPSCLTEACGYDHGDCDSVAAGTDLFTGAVGGIAAAGGGAPCGCEQDGLTFCNFDNGATGDCENCANFDSDTQCYHDGLPTAGANDCAQRCFGGGGGGSGSGSGGSFADDALWSGFGDINSNNWWELHVGEQCSDTCPAGWEGDGICDWDQCNNEACDMDGGDCEGHAAPAAEEDLCAPGCYPGWRGDGWCDSDCYNQACEFDHGDCLNTNMDFDIQEGGTSYGSSYGSAVPSLMLKEVSASVANKPTGATESGSVPVAVIGGAVAVVGTIALYVARKARTAATTNTLPTPAPASTDVC